MKAIVYLRVSTGDQSLGIDAQRKSCEEYCLKNNITIKNEYIDEGFSGSLQPQDRPSLISAIEDLSNGDVLLVAKRDRVARCKKALCLVEMAVESKKARIISAIDEGTWSKNQEDPMAFMMRSMSDIFSEFERLTIKSRTKAALAVKKARGERTGHIPFGYKLAEDELHLEVNEDEQNIITLIKELKDGGLSIRKIAAELNERNKFNRGSKWTKSSTHRILQKVA